MAAKRKKSPGTTASRLSEDMVQVFRYYAKHGSPKHRAYAWKVLRELGIEDPDR